MATWDEVRQAALALPGAAEATSYGDAAWKVGGKSFLWERPLRARDLADLALEAQPGPVLGMRVADEGDKAALLADDPTVFFTTPHFDGYPAVLVWLDALPRERAPEVAEEAWLARAPLRLVKEYMARTSK